MTAPDFPKPRSVLNRESDDYGPELPSAAEVRAGTRDWPHAPPHQLGEPGVYFVTARTLKRVHHFGAPDRLTLVRDHLLELADRYGWRLEAWAVLSNHYHFVGHSPTDELHARSLPRFLKHLHANVTRIINRLEGVEGRKIWHNYRDTQLTFQRSYLARLHYTHANAVHHGVVRVASDYEWCSAAEFESACTPAWFKTIMSFGFEEIAKKDDDVEM